MLCGEPSSKASVWPASLSLEARLRDRIRREGPMPFSQWMEACLYDPEKGYYMRPGRKTGAGDDADFATSPTLDPFMAHCVAREAEACWDAMGRPDDFVVCEFGGGEGDLARDAMTWLRQHSELRPDWLHVERSPEHRQHHTEGEAVADMPSIAHGFVVAHEFLDALPFEVLRRTPDGWQALHVADGPHWLPASDQLTDLAPEVPMDAEVAIMPAVQQWIDDTARRLRAGRVLVVDYGREGPSHDSLRTFRGHQHAGAAWEEPGRKDITADVDFQQVSVWADAAGFDAPSSESQETFLLRHGVLDALNAIDRNTAEGASAYLRLRQMLLPTGMGQAFRVLTLERRS